MVWRDLNPVAFAYSDHCNAQMCAKMTYEPPLQLRQQTPGSGVTSVLAVAARYPSAPASRGCGTGDGLFWEAMTGAANLVTEVPLERWDIDTFYSPELASKKM